MKKFNTMRAAGGLLIATLLTTSAVSGTYAKYVSGDSATDTARVAKFGVVVAASGSLFSDQYIDAPATSGNLTVKSSATGDNVVAPGTNSGEGLTFSITGTPEVAVKLAVEFTNAAGDAISETDEIFLAAKDGLPDMTTGDKTDTFDNADDYYPVVFTLKKGTTQVATGTLSDIADYLNGTDMNVNFIAPNTDLSTAYGTYSLTWAWDFDASGAGTYDKQDTLLGDLAAGTTLTPAVTLTDGTDYNLDCGIQIKISVVQVD